MAETHDHTSEKNMSDATNGCEGSAMLSRRGFLKGIGALALGAVAAKSAISPEVTEAAGQAKRDGEKVIKIVASSKLYRQVVDELRNKGYTFKLPHSVHESSFIRSDSATHLIGLVLHPERTPDARASAHMIVTVNTQDQAVSGLFYNIIWTDGSETKIEEIGIQGSGERRANAHTVRLDDKGTHSQSSVPIISAASASLQLANRKDLNRGSISALQTCDTYSYDKCATWVWCNPWYYKCVKHQYKRYCDGQPDYMYVETPC